MVSSKSPSVSPGKGRDDVGGERDVGNPRTQHGDLLPEDLLRVAAHHALQHRVAAGLERQVELLADGGLGRHDFDEVFGDVDGVRRSEAHAANPVHAGHGLQEAREGPVAVPVGVDRLPEQGDLGDPVVGQAPDFGDHVVGLAVLLRPPHVRHDAEGAAVVASPLDGDPRGHARAPALLQTPVVLVEGQVQHREALFAAPAAAAAARHDLLQRLAEAAVAVGSHDQVHGGDALEQRVPHPLRHAAGHAQHQPGALAPEAAQLADPSQHPFLGVLADGTGVDEDDVRLFGTIHDSGTRAPRARPPSARRRRCSSGSRRSRRTHVSDGLFPTAPRPAGRSVRLSSSCPFASPGTGVSNSVCPRWLRQCARRFRQVTDDPGAGPSDPAAAVIPQPRAGSRR